MKFIIFFLLILILLFCLKSQYNTDKFFCEPKKYRFSKKKWNSKEYKQYNNCYSYALNSPDPFLKQKRYPGKSSHFKRNNSIYTCDYFNKLLKSDYPDLKKTNNFLNCPCDKKYNMISLVLDTTDNKKDFHFYRLDSDMTWSHKPGNNKVRRRDALNNIIYNPKYANHNYKSNNKGNHNYNKFCGYYCLAK